MEIRPILSSLSRSKLAVFLIVLQIAITLAVISNAIAIVRDNDRKIQRSPGSWDSVRDLLHNRCTNCFRIMARDCLLPRVAHPVPIVYCDRHR